MAISLTQTLSSIGTRQLSSGDVATIGRAEKIIWLTNSEQSGGEGVGGDARWVNASGVRRLCGDIAIAEKRY